MTVIATMTVSTTNPNCRAKAEEDQPPPHLHRLPIHLSRDKRSLSTATLSSTLGATPTGKVTFLDGHKKLGSATLLGTGTKSQPSTG